MNIKVADIDLLEPALQQARNVMMHTHRGIQDFEFRTEENMSENITMAIRNQRMSGGFISAISLLVGGIGIMNIMLRASPNASGDGIRKAIGATLRASVPILVERVHAALGGIMGLVLRTESCSCCATFLPRTPVI
jgi:putative ABC transport system permease protein